MKEIDIKKLSKRYTVRKLNLDDVQMIYTFYKRNTQYYEYCGKEPSIELIDKDNPQSNHFWRKNGFEIIREVEIEEGIILAAEKQL